MGIGGHILGAKKLRQLNKWSPIQFDKAYKRGNTGEGRTVSWYLHDRYKCLHYSIDYTNKVVTFKEHPMHWSSCYPVIDRLELTDDMKAIIKLGLI